MIKTGKELAAACVDAAKNYKTLYVAGCFGAPMTDGNKERYTRNHGYNQKPERTAKIRAATKDTFGFDCVCFIKALLWGWRGDPGHVYGGAGYGSNNVPDISESGMINTCREVSTDFGSVAVGEAVWLPGHIGVYIGDGLVAECTPAWEDGVQITACNCDRAGHHRRDWVKHGKLPYLTYEEEPEHWYRVRKSWEDAGSQVGAYRELANAREGCPEGYSVFNWYGNCVYYNGGGEFVTDLQEQFVREVQAAIGAAVDGIPGPETLGKTPTLSRFVNATHAAVKPVQARLWELGYTEVGDADGEAGPKFASAVTHFQQDNGCEVDGEITAGCLTWRKLLGMV